MSITRSGDSQQSAGAVGRSGWRCNCFCRLRVPTAHCPAAHHLILKFHKLQADCCIANVLSPVR